MNKKITFEGQDFETYKGLYIPVGALSFKDKHPYLSKVVDGTKTAAALGTLVATLFAASPSSAEETQLKITDVKPATSEVIQQVYVAPNGTKTVLDENNYQEVMENTGDEIVSYVKEATQDARNISTDRFLNQYSQEADEFIVVPHPDGFFLCRDANDNGACDSGEPRLVDPSDGDKLFTNAGKLITEKIPPKPGSTTIEENTFRTFEVVEPDTLEDALKREAASQNQLRRSFLADIAYLHIFANGGKNSPDHLMGGKFSLAYLIPESNWYLGGEILVYGGSSSSQTTLPDVPAEKGPLAGQLKLVGSKKHSSDVLGIGGGLVAGNQSLIYNGSNFDFGLEVSLGLLHDWTRGKIIENSHYELSSGTLEGTERSDTTPNNDSQFFPYARMGVPFQFYNSVSIIPFAGLRTNTSFNNAEPMVGLELRIKR